MCFQPSPVYTVKGKGSQERPEAEAQSKIQGQGVRLTAACPEARKGSHSWILHADFSPMGCGPHTVYYTCITETRERAVTTTIVQMLPKNDPLMGLRPGSDPGTPHFPYKARFWDDAL